MALAFPAVEATALHNACFQAATRSIAQSPDVDQSGGKNTGAKPKRHLACTSPSLLFPCIASLIHIFSIEEPFSLVIICSIRCRSFKMVLVGYNVALSGTFPGTTHTALQNTITSLGGSVAKSVTRDTNVLVSTPADVNRNSKKVQDAQANGIPIVSIEWVDEAEQNAAAPAFDDFLLVNGTSTATNAKGKGKKRAASPDISTAPTKAPKVGPPDAVPKLEPKVGDGSILKSRDVNIPLDEGCPLQLYRVYIDEDGVVYDASLNKTDTSANNNKFYRVQVNQSTYCLIRQLRTCLASLESKYGRL